MGTQALHGLHGIRHSQYRAIHIMLLFLPIMLLLLRMVFRTQELLLSIMLDLYSHSTCYLSYYVYQVCKSYKILRSKEQAQVSFADLADHFEIC